MFNVSSLMESRLLPVPLLRKQTVTMNIVAKLLAFGSPNIDHFQAGKLALH
jgi:hypothetical protein